jgi:DNA-binding GntR family transcriptional regulator
MQSLPPLLPEKSSEGHKEGGALRGPARDRVFEYVRDGILRGRLAAGTFLEEEQVSAAVGVSRTPVREAFQQLQSERLIDLLPRRGAMVRFVTAQELMEVYETRLMIETHAVRRLCHERRPVPPAMLPILAEMQQQVAPSTFAHVQLNTAFHQALVAASGNGVITGLYESLSSRQERVAVTSVTIDPGRQRIILEEHERLVEALAAHDAAAAIATLTLHLRPVREILAHLPGYTDGTF